MPSYARKHQLSRSLAYHIINRGNGRRDIFHAEADFQHFIQLLREYSRSFDIAIYHWVIMHNHYHFLAEIANPELLSNCMAGLGRAYSHYYHKAYHTSGYLWQGRFKAQPIEKERYLLACGRYIERNPLRAGLVEEAQAYPYSSARFYCLNATDALTTENPAYNGFGSQVFERQNEYRKFLQTFEENEEKVFRNAEHPTGSVEFMKRLIKENGRHVPRRKGKPRKY